jgi:hypothetical protein
VTMQFLFVIASDESFFGVFRSPVDGFPSEVNETFDSSQAIRSIHWVEIRTFFTRPLVTRVHTQVANRPILVIHHKIQDVTDLSVPGLNRTAGYILRAACRPAGYVGPRLELRRDR